MVKISRLAYQIVADTEGFTRGMRLTRQETALQNQVLRDSIQPLQAYAAEQLALEHLFAKKAISEQQYTASMARLAASHPDAIAAAQQLAAAEQKLAADMQAAQTVIDRHTSAQARYAEQVQRLAALKSQGLFQGNEAAYRAELDRLKETLPAIQAKRQAEAAAAEQAQQTAAAVGSVEQSLRDQAAAAVMSGDAFQRWKLAQQGATPTQLATVDALQKQTAAAKAHAAAVERGRQAVAALRGPLADYRSRVDDLRRAKQAGAVTQRQYTAAQRAARGELLGTIPVYGRFLKAFTIRPPRWQSPTASPRSWAYSPPAYDLDVRASKVGISTGSMDPQRAIGEIGCMGHVG